jgi:multiple sugar transport system permease protein
MRKKETLLDYFFVGPAILLLISIQIYPLLYSFFISLHDFRILRPDLTQFIWFQNYFEILEDEEFLNAFFNTITYVGIAIPCELVLGFILALAIEKVETGRNLIRAFILIPLFVAPIATGFIWKFLYNDEFGIINFILRYLGMNRPPLWLNDPELALYSCIIVEVWATVPFFVLMLSAGMASLSLDLVDAGKIDGATPFQRVVHIIIPHLKPIILISVLLRGMDAFRVFDVIYSLTEGAPAMSTDVLSLYLYRIAMLDRQFGLGASAAWFMVILMLIVSYLLIKFVYRKSLNT